MNATLLAILINQIGIPELTAWLRARHGQTITDADIIAKLAADTNFIQQVGEQWLAAHPAP